MTANLVALLIMEGIALLLFWFAYAIGVRGQYQLIAGYNARSAEQVTDKPGLGRLVAHCCITVGLASALLPFAMMLFGQTTAGYFGWLGAYGGVIGGTIVMTFLQARQFTRPAGA